MSLRENSRLVKSFSILCASFPKDSVLYLFTDTTHIKLFLISENNYNIFYSQKNSIKKFLYSTYRVIKFSKS